jgi:hypothetical protein
MTTIELTQTQLSDNCAHSEAQRRVVLETAKNVGSWLMERFSGSEYPAGKTTTVPSFEETHMSTQEKGDWFNNNEYPFGD